MNKILFVLTASVPLLFAPLETCSAQLTEFEFVQDVTGDSLVRLILLNSSPQDEIELLEFTQSGASLFGDEFLLTQEELRIADLPPLTQGQFELTEISPRIGDINTNDDPFFGVTVVIDPAVVFADDYRDKIEQIRARQAFGSWAIVPEPAYVCVLVSALAAVMPLRRR